MNVSCLRELLLEQPALKKHVNHPTNVKKLSLQFTVFKYKDSLTVLNENKILFFS